MPTNVTYNGITLTNVHTLAFRQNVQLDDSGTDLLYHQFTIRVACVAHASGATLFHGYKSGETAGTSQIELQRKLEQTRAAFEYKVGDDVLLAANSDTKSKSVDVNNGPKPTHCSITHIAGTNSMRIEWEIVIAVIKGDGLSPGELPAKTQLAIQMNGVLNNRWSAEESYDENFYRTRIIEGKLRVKHIDIDPQTYQQLLVPKLQVGWKRVSGSFTTAPNGLELRYTVKDREMAAAPPWPATSWRGSCSQVVETNGAKIRASCTVYMEGPPVCDKKLLLERCVQVASQRIPTIRQNVGGVKALVESANYLEYLHKNAVEVNFRVLLSGEQPKIYGMFETLFGRTLSLPGYLPRTQAIPAGFDAQSPTGIFAMHLQQPHDAYHGLLPTDAGQDQATAGISFYQQENPEGSPGDSENPDSGGGGLAPDGEDGVSSEHNEFPYEYYYTVSSYTDDSGQIALLKAEQATSTATSLEMIKLTHGTTLHIIETSAARWGAQPVFPTMPKERIGASGVKEYFEYGDTEVEAPITGPDGQTLLYKAKRIWAYRVARKLEPSDKIEVEPNKMFDIPDNKHKTNKGGTVVSTGGEEFTAEELRDAGLGLDAAGNIAVL